MEQGKRSLGRTLMFTHEGNARLSHAQTARGIADQFTDCRIQFGGVGNLDRCSGSYR